jgi:hypothetical protein
MSMIRIILGTFIGMLLAVIVLYAGFSYWQWRATRAYFAPPTVPSPPVSFQDKMLRRNMWRDHATQRWYPYWQLIGNRCLVSGAPADATFQCARPLTGGVPDEK